jgi:hypothetical protein
MIASTVQSWTLCFELVCFFVICAYGSAVVVSMLAIYALIANPLLLFVMVKPPRITS